MNGLLLALALCAHATDIHVNPRANQGSGNTGGAAGAVVNSGVGGTQGTALQTGPASLTGSMPNLAPNPTLSIAPGAAPISAANAGGVTAGPAPVAPSARGAVNTAPGRIAPGGPAAAQASPLAGPDAAPASMGAALEGAPAAARQRAGPAAAGSLGGAVRDVQSSRVGAAPSAAAERAALDKTFDAMLQGQALSGFNGATRNAVAGQVQTLRGRVDQALDNARAAPPADAPAHYTSVLEFLKDKLVPAAYSSMEKAVKRVAFTKADRALDELAAETYAAAARGDAKETKRLLKGFDAWQGLLGTPSRPLVSNGALLSADVSRRLEAARSGAGAPAATRTQWFVRRGDQYTALLPGSAIARLAPIAASFSLQPSAVLAAADFTASWRAYAADPRSSRGFAEVYKGRRARGSSVPEALVAAARFWLRDVLSALWRRLTGLFSGGAYALNTPSGAAALRADLTLQSEVSARGAAVRAALDSGAPTVGRARAALEQLAAQAAAHERLRGRAAAAGASALASVFAAASAGLPDSAPLTDGLAELAFGADGILRQAQLMSRDAARAVDGRVLAQSADFSHAEGSRLWTKSGAVSLSADLRASGAGGFIDLRAPGGEPVAQRLAALGFTTRLQGGVVTASYDADGLDLPAEGMTELAREALEAAAGRPAPAAASLLAKLRAALSDRRQAQARAAALGPLPAARYIGELSVDGVPYRAYSTGRVSFLRGASGVPAFAAP